MENNKLHQENNYKNIKFLRVIKEIKKLETDFSKDQGEIENIVNTILNSVNPKKIIFIGSGGSWCSLYPANAMVQKMAYDTYSWIINPNEFLFRVPAFLDKDTILIAASNSGNTPEIIEAVKISNKKGCTTIGLTANSESLLCKESSYTFTYPRNLAAIALPTYSNMITLNIIKNIYSLPIINRLLEDHINLPKILKNIQEQSNNIAMEASSFFKDVKHISIVGSGMSSALAYHLAVIGLPEFSWVQASYIPGEDFLHGPLELVKESFPILFIKDNNHKSRALTERIVNFVEKLKGYYYIFDTKNIAPDTSEYLTSLMLFSLERWFIYYMGQNNNHNPDEYRYMGKTDY